MDNVLNKMANQVLLSRQLSPRVDQDTQSSRLSATDQDNKKRMNAKSNYFRTLEEEPDI